MNHPKPHAWRRSVAFAGVVVAAMTGCSSSSNSDDAAAAPPAADVTSVKSHFWQALGDGKIDEVGKAREEMISALASHPDDHELARWIGFSAIVPFAATDGPPTIDPARIGPLMDEGVTYTKMGVDLASDGRQKTYNSDFYGGLLYSRARFQNDAAAAEVGRSILEKVAQAIPAFGFLSRADIMVNEPKRSPDFALALESYFRFYEQCTGTKLDRERPELSAVLKRPFADQDTTCTNWEHAPHGIQGGLLKFGDALVKAGKVEAARPVYEMVKRTDGFSTWKFAKTIDERLSSSLEARAAQYDAPGDPRRQPPVGGGCMSCHQR